MRGKAANSPKAQRDKVRDQMRDLGCTVPQIAAELSRRFPLRPRVAWRYALGWSQWKLAQHYNTLHTGAKLSESRVSEFEAWPHGGKPPTLRYLVRLAATYGHGCTAALLVDAADLEHLNPADRSLLTTGHAAEPPITIEASDALSRAKARDRVNSERTVERGTNDTVVVWGSRRLVRCDAWGLPLREEVIMAADESAQFRRWSATTNVDDEVLEQMTADVAELAWGEQIDPPATTYARLLGARDDVFRLIAGHQQPRHTTSLYKIAGQVSAMLSIVTFDLGHPHAANTHARTALHCAEVSGHTSLRVFIRGVQSNIAYWDGRYDEAAQLMDTALPDATSGTTLLRLASQQARINAARNRPDEVTQALELAATAPTERTSDEPGVLGFDLGSAAMSASEAHHALDGAEHLDAAVHWAHTALDEFTAEAQPKAMYVAAARFDLALAYLARGELEAAGEHLTPVLHATGAEYRTVTIIGRARSLNTLLDQRPDLASSTLAALRDSLAEFTTQPASTPAGLEPGTPT